MITAHYQEMMRLCFSTLSSQNYLLEGENFRILNDFPLECVDMIYTDPPYATGKRFRYNDSWKKPQIQSGEAIYVTEQEVGHHANWVNFLANRLHHMRRVLKPTGIIAISIGKDELFRLGILMDKIFGEENQLGLLNWQKRYSPSNDSKHLSDTTDYVLIYAKERHSGSDHYESHDQGITLLGNNDPCFDLDRMKIGDVPLMPFPLSWYHMPFVLGSQSWKHEYSGHNQEATRLLNAIMGGGHHLSSPKPLKLLEKIIQLWCPPNGIVLDPFAGSGTTGHAILDLNAKTHAQRRFLLVEQGNLQTQDRFAQTLTAERLRRVLSGDWASGPQPPLPGKFTFLSTLEPNLLLC